MQFNARTTPQTVEALYAIADRQGWLVGETLERPLAALQREAERTVGLTDPDEAPEPPTTGTI
jgi:hypothetical protein